MLFSPYSHLPADNNLGNLANHFSFLVYVAFENAFEYQICDGNASAKIGACTLTHPCCIKIDLTNEGIEGGGHFLSKRDEDRLSRSVPVVSSGGTLFSGVYQSFIPGEEWGP